MGDRSVLGFLLSNAHLVRDVARARHFGSLRLDDALFIVGSDGPLEGDVSPLRNDLDVVRVAGQIFVVHQRATNGARQFPVGRVLLLLVGGLSVFRPISCVDFGVIRWRLTVCDGGRDDTETRNRGRKNDSLKTMLMHTLPLQRPHADNGQCGDHFRVDSLIERRSCKNVPAWGRC